MTARVGMLLYGYCAGYFGRNLSHTKRIEGIGADWVVVREENGDLSFASFASTKNMEQLLAEWSEDKEVDGG